jgi:ornithine carbamoyltransferase
MVISGYARAVVIRTFSHQDVVRFAGAATVPVINALTDLHHPCQALADLLTLKDHFGSLRGLRLAYVGAGNNVAHSLIQGCALAGVEIHLATPLDLGVSGEIVADARDRGGVVEVSEDPRDAVREADAVYTDVWLSMGDPEHEQDLRRVLLAPYRVTEDLMALAGDEAVFMHCLPAHRGDEVTAPVIDGPRSVVAAQAENRMHTEEAMLVALLSGELSGAR